MVDVGDRIPLLYPTRDELVIFSPPRPDYAEDGVTNLIPIVRTGTVEWISAGANSHYKLGGSTGLLWLINVNRASPIADVIFNCTKLTVEWQYVHGTHASHIAVIYKSDPLLPTIDAYPGEGLNIAYRNVTFTKIRQTFDLPAGSASYGFSSLDVYSGLGGEMLLWEMILHK